MCQGGLGAYKKKSLHLQLCNKLKAALRKSVHLYYTLPPKVQASRKMKYCKNQRKWMTTNCALDTAQQLYKWNDSSRDCTYKTGRKSSHTKPQHEAGRNSCPQQKSYWWLRGRFFFFPSGMQSLRGYLCTSRHTWYTCMELSINKTEKTEHLLKTK